LINSNLKAKISDGEKVILMKKKGLFLAILVAFSFGLFTGITTVMVKGGKEFKEPEISKTTSIPLTKEPISIELTEKIEDLKEMVRENSKDLAAWVKLGNIYAEHQRYREAAEAYSQFLSIKPNDSDIRTNLGLMLRGLGDYDGAVEEFKKAAKDDPKHTSTRYYLGLTLLQNKRNIQEGIEAWEDYLKVEPEGQMANQVRVEIERLKKR
jgi:cytochrome c-type biogenesis protein CcmH/NrfG